jgi:hypothetical protein
MIVLQELLQPTTTVDWAVYKSPAKIGWLHAEQRDLTSPDQRYPATGPRTVIPTAVFSVEEYLWEVVEW